MLKKVLNVLVVIVALLLLIPATLPNKFSMARSIDIHATPAAVYTRLPDLNEYNKWNPFPEGDPSNQTQVSGVGQGSSLSWQGEKTGEGKMTITGLEENKRVDIHMEFFRPMSGEGMVHWTLNEKGADSTELTWSFEQDLIYFNRYFGLFMDGMMGQHFERGLAKYKAIVEGG